MDINKELTGATSSILVLSVLAREASYGYQIIKRLNDTADGAFVWQEGTIYPILHKLEKDDLVRSQWQDADTGRRRKYYYITAKGREGLTEGSRQWGEYHRMILSLAELPNG
ncbi:MAG: PadR family transcriptional regulator [FCB group bacterium]|jgi:DNA-binding PadR family transcriptional regulator|nr:PadR family transcriptional regulator [FCB group bacterium]